ncbi:type 1 glutamine amidotransferase domain-containing protein [Leptospira montravelensis]|uniref:Type 1 glutamine amidotransferase domain-containing protein n=2 Tax=Leptospira montravelensis TaxID=2484961 RepID=A0ABY2LQK6_9LEPT|nr:DJ-1/PfpI family protein [Leptospira montravelensis]TGK80834.1 type 1 glutamine amidotransferase domain-containing protein [Leptospira montravelensis]TGL01883.1 type 1 glutamine amidotransferase domain-containing protein [Leptospira montravelensis]
MPNPTWSQNHFVLSSNKILKRCQPGRSKFFKRILLSMVLIISMVVNHSSIFANSEPKPKVLIVMSAANTLLLDENHKHPTGVFLNELFYPAIRLYQSGFALEFATPNGKKSTLDPESLKDKYWNSKEEKEEAIRFLNSLSSFQKPISLELAIKNNKSYTGLLIPGGQGLMTDLLYDPNLPILLTKFQEQEKKIGLVCHAPALLITLPSGPNGEGFLFQGYHVNSVTKMEEWFIETFVMKGKPKVRKISELLKERGMLYESSIFPASGFATRDRNLVTSQNPFSGEEFTKLYLDAIKDSLKKSSF